MLFFVLFVPACIEKNINYIWKGVFLVPAAIFFFLAVNQNIITILKMQALMWYSREADDIPVWHSLISL